MTLGWSVSAQAATLPEHEPLRIVIVSDEVNPHDLPDDRLTQPGEMAQALMAPDSGLNIASVDEVDSSCIDAGLDAIDAGQTDVVIYFAHRTASTCAGADAQDALTGAMEKHLINGGGVVVFHHGIFTAGGKQEILQLLGGSAGRIAWEPDAGQNVIAVAPEHFVASNGLSFSQDLDVGANDFGAPEGNYPAFNNTPDERYPDTRLNTEPGEERTILFASDFAGPQVLGYDLRRPDWSGHVLYYQPGEYQPNALDDRSGPNFQILANAIYYAATTQDDVEPPEPTSGSDGETSDGETSDDGTSGEVTDGETSASNGNDNASGPSNGDSGGDTDGTPQDSGGSGGCSVGAGPTSALWWALVVPLVTIRRQRRLRTA